VVAVAGHATLAAASDGEVMRWAAGQGRRLVTENVKDSSSRLGTPTRLIG
jgi:hypothetical protein